MDEQEVRRVIAEFMGWRNIGDCPYCQHWQGEPMGGAPRNHVPDYPHDLNAMHEVEQELSRRMPSDAEYLDALHDLVTSADLKLWELGHGIYEMVTATAAQRAQAAYQVITQHQRQEQEQQQKEG